MESPVTQYIWVRHHSQQSSDMLAGFTRSTGMSVSGTVLLLESLNTMYTSWPLRQSTFLVQLGVQLVKIAHTFLCTISSIF